MAILPRCVPDGSAIWARMLNMLTRWPLAVVTQFPSTMALTGVPGVYLRAPGNGWLATLPDGGRHAILKQRGAAQ